MAGPVRSRDASTPVRTAVLAALLLAPPGCSEAGGSDPEFEARMDALEGLVQQRCEASERCDCTPTAAQGGCASALRDDWRARLVAGAQRGLSYDAGCVDTIAAAIEAHGCQWPAIEANPCQDFCQLFHGERALGERCDGFDMLVSDCAQGLLCERGRCVEPCTRLAGLPEGASCRDGPGGQQLDRCAEGLLCDYERARCVQPATLGASCESLQCDEALWCDYGTHLCLPRGTVGERCEVAPCAQGLACGYTPPDYIGECVPEPREGDSCADVGCASGLWCDGESICRARADAGEPCDARPCRDGLVCDAALRCGEPPPAGQPCAEGECERGAYCDFSGDIAMCLAGAAVAEPCSGHRQCASGYCPAGYCEHPPQLGESCERTLVCALGTSCDGSVCRASVTHGPAVCVYEAW